MKIGVSGASSHLGRAVVSDLLQHTTTRVICARFTSSVAVMGSRRLLA